MHNCVNQLVKSMKLATQYKNKVDSLLPTLGIV